MKITVKRAAIVTVLAALMIFAAFATACAPSTFTVTFDYNYEGAPAAATVEVGDGERATVTNSRAGTPTRSAPPRPISAAWSPPTLRITRAGDRPLTP